MMILLPLDMQRVLRCLFRVLLIYRKGVLVVISKVFLKSAELLLRLIHLLKAFHWARAEGASKVHLPHDLPLELSIGGTCIHVVMFNKMLRRRS
jgi:hypothetical protein